MREAIFFERLQVPQDDFFPRPQRGFFSQVLAVHNFSFLRPSEKEQRVRAVRIQHNFRRLELQSFLRRGQSAGEVLGMQLVPGKDKEVNWLPSPKGPFFVVMRLYWPKDAAVSGQWKAPPLKRIQ